MHFLDIILKKRNAEILTKEEIGFFVSSYVKGEIPDYQVSALLMAIWFSKMNEQETADLTFAMRDSGAIIDLSDIEGIKVDKHSTGGVADTTTLIIAPIVAACGLKVAKMSGRGLGHTGGTIDKLESIPGLTTAIGMNRFKEIVAACGMSIIAQTSDLVPADKLLYGLRDVTGTVDNLSLIAASIMSKKLASGSDFIVLDVKSGNGAFMKSCKEAEELAVAMVRIGKMAGKKAMAVVTDMNQPLGNAVGNALEVREAIGILQGSYTSDLCDVSIHLATQLLAATELPKDEHDASQMVKAALDSGRALEQLAQMIDAQGGDPRVCENPRSLAESAKKITVTSPVKGYLTEIATAEIGMAAMLLGAGRAHIDDTIDPSVGLWMKKRCGDFTDKGDELAVFYVTDTKNLEQAKQRFISALVFNSEPPGKRDLIYKTIT